MSDIDACRENLRESLLSARFYDDDGDDDDDLNITRYYF